jgi:hypothetical protein
MISNELIDKINKFCLLSHFAFYSEKEKPKLVKINKDIEINPIDLFEYLIDFVFIDHRYYHAGKRSWRVWLGINPSKEVENERRAIMLGEIYDLLMDIGLEIIEMVSNYFKSDKLQAEDLLKIQDLKKKFDKLSITREHNLQGGYMNIASLIKVTLNTLLKDNNGKVSLKSSSYLNSEALDKVREILKSVFSGYNDQQRRVMSENNYKRLVEYTIHLVETNTLPEKIISIPRMDLTDQFILTTYRRIFDLMEKDQSRRKVFCVFINKCFDQFKDSGFSEEDYRKSVIYKKFSRPNRTYEAELKMFSY